MNLVIDIGNTHIKAAVFKDHSIVFQKRFSAVSLKDTIVSSYNKYPIKRGIISNVSKLPGANIDELFREYNIHLLSHKSKTPFKNRYATPETLGVDRIALSAAAADQFPAKNTLVIDAGTCITYDFLTAENDYLGGAISPGIRIRYKALHTFTGNLPLLESGDFSDVTGNSTATSIHSGVLNGVINEIEGIIAQYSTKYKDLTVILTGGDAQFLSKRLKNSIFVNPNFLMEGLNVVLGYN